VVTYKRQQMKLTKSEGKSQIKRLTLMHITAVYGIFNGGIISSRKQKISEKGDITRQYTDNWATEFNLRNA